MSLQTLILILLQLPQKPSFVSSPVANMPELPFPAPEPHPKETIEMILKTMEKIPGDAPLDSQTRLADIGFVKEDFKPFETYCRHLYAS